MSLLVDLSIEAYETVTEARCILKKQKVTHTFMQVTISLPYMQLHTQHKHTHMHRFRKKEEIQRPHAFSINSVRSQILTFHQNQPSPIASARMEPSDINITLQLVRLESHKYDLSYAKTGHAFLICP